MVGSGLKHVWAVSVKRIVELARLDQAGFRV